MSRRGLALVDVIVAAAVLGLALVPVIQLFGSASRQAANTSSHGQALALLAKCGDELRVASWEDPYLLEDEIGGLARGGRREKIVDGGSPFFAPVEDVKAPHGRLDAADGGIEPSAKALYRQLAGYRMAMVVPASTPPDEPVGLAMVTDWSIVDQKPVEARVPVDVPRMGRWTDVPAPVRDRARADAAIAALFFGANVTLEAGAAACGAKVQALRQLGELALVTRGVTEHAAATQAEIGAFVALFGDAEQGPRARLAVARLFESRAAVALQAIVHLEPHVRAVADGLEAADLGTLRLGPWRELALDARGLRAVFQTALQIARAGYRDLYNSPAGASLAPRVRVRVLLKLLDLTKLAALTFSPVEVTSVRAVAQALLAAQEGRNPSFAAFANSEVRRSADLAALQAADPVPRRAEAFRELGQREVALVDRVTRATGGLPAAPAGNPGSTGDAGNRPPEAQ